MTAIGDRAVEAAVQRSKLGDRERGVALDGEVRNVLTQIAIVMHNPVQLIAKLEQIAAIDLYRNIHSESVAASPPDGPEIRSSPTASPSPPASSLRVNWTRYRRLDQARLLLRPLTDSPTAPLFLTEPARFDRDDRGIGRLPSPLAGESFPVIGQTLPRTNLSATLAGSVIQHPKFPGSSRRDPRK